MSASTFPERLAILEAKVEQAEQTRLDVEARLRKIERNQWLAAGFIAALQVVLKFL